VFIHQVSNRPDLEHKSMPHHQIQLFHYRTGGRGTMLTYDFKNDFMLSSGLTNNLSKQVSDEIQLRRRMGTNIGF
jgi:hypothetical protein